MKLYTAGEAARIIGCSRNSLCKVLAAEEIEGAYKERGVQWHIPEDALPVLRARFPARRLPSGTEPSLSALRTLYVLQLLATDGGTARTKRELRELLEKRFGREVSGKAVQRYVSTLGEAGYEISREILYSAAKPSHVDDARYTLISMPLETVL